MRDRVLRPGHTHRLGAGRAERDRLRPVRRAVLARLVGARPIGDRVGERAPPPTSASPDPTVNPALRSVQVGYALVKRLPGGFEGQFTIVNKSRTVIRDWRLTMVLPDDHVQSAWDASFQETGNTVTLVPPPYALTIPVGARITEQFTATGTTTRPVSCTFSGVPC